MNNDRIIYKVVRAYYENRMTQQEIGNKYGISRMKVSRLLNKALREKIVEIKINSPIETYSQLEHRIENKYGLKEVVVAKAEENEQNEVVASIGRAAATYIESFLQGNEIVGVSWGNALLSTVNSLNNKYFPDLQVVQIIGGLGEPETGLHGADLTRRIAEKFSGRPRLIHAPGIVRSKEVSRELLNDIQVKNSLQVAAKADIALVGIGLFDFSSQVYRTDDILSKADKKILADNYVIGDISFRFFNSEGQFVTTEIDERVIGLSAEQLKNIPRIIGIAGGENKYSLIKAALKGGLIHVLITDNYTAEKLATEE